MFLDHVFFLLFFIMDILPIADSKFAVAQHLLARSRHQVETNSNPHSLYNHSTFLAFEFDPMLIGFQKMSGYLVFSTEHFKIILK